MSGQQQLSPCRIALHESWANFPAKDYKRVLVFVAFLTPEGELLLTKDKEGNWGMPYEHFLRRDILRAVPERLIEKSLGIDLQQIRVFSQVKLLGACEIGSDYCVVLLTRISVLFRLPRWRFVAGAALEPYAKQQPVLPLVTDYLWSREVMAA